MRLQLHPFLSLAALLLWMAPSAGASDPAPRDLPDRAGARATTETPLVPPRFETLTVADGLVSNDASAFLQDRQGFLWVGTFGGLSRFDGARFKNFLHDPADAESLVQNNVNSLFEDRTGAIWVGTNGGLDRFDPETETFTHHLHDPADPRSLSHDVVRVVVEGAAGAIWIGTRGGGLNRLDPATGALTRIHRTLHDPARAGDEVHALLANDDGTLWVGGSDGLALYDPSADLFSVVRLAPDDPAAPRLPAIYSLCRDSDGTLWAGTRTDGLFRYDPATRATVHYPSLPTVPGALGNPWVLSMTLDRTGTLWVGTNGAGLHRYDREADAFVRYRYDPSNPQSLRDDNVLALLETRDEVLWAGTYGGLARRYPLSRHVAREGVRAGDERGLRSNAVTAFAEDAAGTLWIGTDGAGLHRREASTAGVLTQVPYEPSRPHTRAATDVLSLAVDDDDALWVGAVGGLYHRDPDRNAFLRFSDEHADVDERGMIPFDLEAGEGRVLGALGLDGILEIEPRSGRSIRARIVGPPQLVTAALRDRAGEVWAGTYDAGLWRRVERLGGPGLERVPVVLSSREVTSLYEDRAGAVWIGTADGLDRLIVEGDKLELTRFHRADGLPSTSIKDVLEDGQGRLWVATAAGLSWRNPQTGAFVSYGARDGMEPGGPLYQSPRTGTIYVGGYVGYATFDPRALTVEAPPPPPVLTELRLLGSPVRVGAEESPLRRALSSTDELRLRHDHRIVTFAFASLDFRAPSTHRYAVRLDGFDEDWREVGEQRDATFTSLRPGRYTLRVRAAGRDGVWGEPTALAVVVAPPPWRAWWAYLGYVVLALGIGGAVVRNRRHRLRLQHRMEMEQLEAEKLRELDQTRSRFFANVSHELRTPLTLTLGPLADLEAGRHGPLPAPVAGQVDLARRNASRVLDLVNQILDVARLEAGRTPLRARPLDLGAFVESVAQPFRAAAARKAVAFEVMLPDPPVEVYADPTQLEKAVANLLSNALKFTPEGGRVRVSVAADEGGARVEIRDSGPGIPDDDLPHVFDRFYQVDAANQAQLGTGIGLALAKEVVDLHGGRLAVASEVGFGSTFTIALPLGKAHLSPDQIDEATEPGKDPWVPGRPSALLVAEPVDASEVEAVGAVDPTPGEDVTTVLVVEDHPEMRAYLRRHLEGGASGYRILEAIDGEEGLAKARASLPDLVVSDVMMPRLDGLGLCRALRADPETDFLPVILLTAKAAPEDKLEGLAEHCDDYLTKPFDPAELRARIANLIASRQRLRERYRQEDQALVPGAPTPSPLRLSAPADVPSVDEVFLERVRTAIEMHLDDESFSVERLAEAVAMSRGHLYRQLKALTGQAPSEVIRTLRLERAADLLTRRAGTVSEVAYAVGFKSVGHFSDSFVQAYGCRPSSHAGREGAAGDESA